MIPNLPTNLYNIVFVVGAFLLAYSFLQYEKFSTKHEVATKRQQILTSEFKDRDSLFKVKEERLTQNLLLLENQGLNGRRSTRNGEGLKVEIEKRQQEIARLKVENSLLKARSNRQLNSLTQEIASAESSVDTSWAYILVSGFIAGVGIVGLMIYQIRQDSISKNTSIAGLTFLECQSCGKAFDATVERAKFQSGALNKYYCTQCFDGSGFTDDSLDANHFVLLYLSNSPSKHMTKSKADKYIMSLRRWQKGEY